MLDTLNSERFADTAPAAVHATLLDEGRYLGSVRTMYRVLGAQGGTRERRNQRVLFDLTGLPKASPVEGRVCAQHGRELMGCKSPVGVPTWTHRSQG